MMAKTLNEDFPPLEAVARKPEAKPEKMALWKAAFVTDPTAVKPITGKQYKGNSPKPYWLIQRATEVFGACGIGWGLEVINERFERLTDTDVLHVALIRVWYEYEGKRGAVEQMGQTKACYKTNSGTMMVDEDAPKKSVTDGMVKCLSMLGFAGDIFSGRWDDSKYVAEAAAETKRRTDAENPLPHYMDEQIKANSGAWEKSIKAGKTTPEKIIAMVLSKYTLTDEQKVMIEALATPEQEREAA